MTKQEKAIAIMQCIVDGAVSRLDLIARRQELGEEEYESMFISVIEKNRLKLDILRACPVDDDPITGVDSPEHICADDSQEIESVTRAEILEDGTLHVWV